MNIQRQFETLLESSQVNSALEKYVKWYNNKFDISGEKTITGRRLEVQKAKRWIKLWNFAVIQNEVDNHSKSAFAFIDPENGEAFKPAGHRAPAKGVRANVLDLESMKKATGSDGIGFGRLR